MANIFLLPFTKPNNEDYFTASLAYLIDNVPQIGQKIVNLLFTHPDRPLPKFVKVVDHPNLANGNYPDFMIQCEEVDIIGEHKLTSDLGYRQLEHI